MPTLPQFSLAVATTLVLGGCAAVGVVATDDPRAKLADAVALFDHQDRPIPAERLIHEAISICSRSADRPCLADAFRAYGFFFRSPALTGKWSKTFQESGFLDKTATYASRYMKSVEYFEKAAEIYRDLGRHGALTNVLLNKGFSQVLASDTKAACISFDLSLEAHLENVRLNPGVRPTLPQGYATYQEYVALRKAEASCPAR